MHFLERLPEGEVLGEEVLVLLVPEPPRHSDRSRHDSKKDGESRRGNIHLLII